MTFVKVVRRIKQSITKRSVMLISQYINSFYCYFIVFDFHFKCDFCHIIFFAYFVVFLLTFTLFGFYFLLLILFYRQFPCNHFYIIFCWFFVAYSNSVATAKIIIIENHTKLHTKKIIYKVILNRLCRSC